MDYYQQAAEAARTALKLSGRSGENFPKVGLILGSGLGDLAGQFKDQREIPYSAIEGFPVPALQGHAGTLVLGELAGCQTVCLNGRAHLYEGFSARETCLGVRVLGMLKVKILIISNAAGALNPLWQAGELMLISDHINMTGHNPLTGPNYESWGARYPDMSQAYCPELQKMAMEAALGMGIRLNRGVYAALAGPSLETPAETRALRRLGADAVGMSTVLEIIAARHMGIRTLGFSCLTNKNLPDCMTQVTEEEIIGVAARAGHDLNRLVGAILRRLSAADLS